MRTTIGVIKSIVLIEHTALSQQQMMDVWNPSRRGYTVKMLSNGRFAVVGRTSGHTWKVLDTEDDAWKWRENMENARDYIRGHAKKKKQR